MKLIATHLMAFAIGVLGTLAYQAKAQSGSVPAAVTQIPSTVVASAPVVDEALANSNHTVTALTKKAEPDTATALLTNTLNYVEQASVALAELMPAYSNVGSEANLNARAAGSFGLVVVDMYKAANTESFSKAKAVKMAACDNLQNVFTCQALDQSELHVPQYAELIRETATSGDRFNWQAVEAIQIERMKDEAAIEALVNPSLWQRLKWWWKS